MRTCLVAQTVVVVAEALVGSDFDSGGFPAELGLSRKGFGHSFPACEDRRSMYPLPRRFGFADGRKGMGWIPAG